MRIAYLRRRAQKMGLLVDSTFIFDDDTKRDVVAQRSDGATFALQNFFLNKKGKRHERYAYVATYLGTQRVITSTRQALDCLKAFTNH